MMGSCIVEGSSVSMLEMRPAERAMLIFQDMILVWVGGGRCGCVCSAGRIAGRGPLILDGAGALVQQLPGAWVLGSGRGVYQAALLGPV